MNNPLDFTGKVALVTGVAAGMGLATAQAFAEAGAAVVLAGFKGGRVLDYEGKAERQMCRLYLSMMDKMNVRLPKFGDAAKALEEV